MKQIRLADDPVYQVLLPYCLGLRDPATNRGRLDVARPLFDTVTAEQTMVLVDAIMEQVDDIEEVKIIVTRMLHSFNKALNRENRPFPKDLPLFKDYLARNDAIVNHLDELKPLVIQMNAQKLSEDEVNRMDALIAALDQLTDYYTTKEHVLFPAVERHIAESRCVQLMWAIHDDVRNTIKTLHKEKPTELTELNRLFGKLFFDMRSMVFREEQVLFPVLAQALDQSVFADLAADQHDQGQVSETDVRIHEGTVDLITGNPTAQQLIHIFNNLPVDITLVDADDRVVYFNTPKHRMFPRTKAIIGRSVQNCHPPKSLHVVQQILGAFRAKERSVAEFTITVQGRYVRILYTAIYDASGEYAGTLEVSQDITEIQQLSGEKRLLDWS
jgi:PAS domain S-box-containing protein